MNRINVGDEVFVVQVHKPTRGKVLAVLGEDVAVNAGGEMVWVQLNSNYARVFATFAEAALTEQASLRKQAKALRAEASKKIDRAEEMELEAADLLAKVARREEQSNG